MPWLARASFAAALDTLAVPILLVGAGLQIIHGNAAADAVLARGDLIRRVNGALSVVSRGARSALEIAVEHAARDESEIGRRGLGIPLHRDDGPAGALHVLPLRDGRTGGHTGAAAAIFIADSDTPFVPPTEIVTALFGLSAAEAKVFAHIAQGRGVPAAAEALGIGRATVRTHLARLYGKIGARRPSDLVRIAASLAVPLLL